MSTDLSCTIAWAPVILGGYIMRGTQARLVSDMACCKISCVEKLRVTGALISDTERGVCIEAYKL